MGVESPALVEDARTPGGTRSSAVAAASGFVTKPSGRAHISDARERVPPGKRRSWRQDPEGRRATIIEAAKRAFAANGYARSRTEDIARDAGVAEGTIFHLFGSKRGLLDAVGEEYGQGMARAAFGGGEAEYSPLDMETIVRNIFQYVRETEGALAGFLLANDPLEGGPAQDANRRRMVHAIEANLDRWTQEGLMMPAHAQILAEIHFSLVEGALRDCFLRRGGAEEEAYISECVRVLGASLMAPG